MQVERTPSFFNDSIMMSSSRSRFVAEARIAVAAGRKVRDSFIVLPANLGQCSFVFPQSASSTVQYRIATEHYLEESSIDDATRPGTNLNRNSIRLIVITVVLHQFVSLITSYQQIYKSSLHLYSRSLHTKHTPQQLLPTASNMTESIKIEDLAAFSINLTLAAMGVRPG
jgi:hypothetical protein